jgi:hypothetical protein
LFPIQVLIETADIVLVSVRAADLPTPLESPVYQLARELAGNDNIENEFRWFCALLEAPSDLRWIGLVADNLLKAVSGVPENWDASRLFGSLVRVGVWIEANNVELRRIRAANELGAAGESSEIPMHRCWESFPLYTMMCQIQEDPAYRRAYRLLQLQLLSARGRELDKQYGDDLAKYIDTYEAFDVSGEKDRASERIRFSNTAARQVRLLKQRAASTLVDFMQPELLPENFGSAVLRKIDDGVPYGLYFGQRARAIARYCKDSSARIYTHRESHERISAKSTFTRGYIEYSPSLVGVYFEEPDRDDCELNEPANECLLFRAMDPDTAELHDEHPDETGTLGLIATNVNADRNGVTPAQMARARASVLRLEIDRESLPWSAGQLRPAEIIPNLLSTLKRIDATPPLDSKQSREQLEIAALVAVCLETGRLPQNVFNLPVGEDPKAHFSIIHRPRAGQPALWCWQAIEPSMKSPHTFVSGKEASRAQFITNPISETTRRLVSNLIRISRRREQALFASADIAYEERVRVWLKAIDGGERLTISKIAGMQWSILTQLTANDYTAASMTLGVQHPRACVPLFYAVIPVTKAQQLFRTACSRVWGEELADVSC